MFGTRWVSRHQNVDTGAKFLEEAIKLDPENEGAFHYLRDAYGRKGGDWDRVLSLAEEAVTHIGRERQRDVPPRAGGDDRVASARQPDPRANGLRAPQPDQS